MVTAGTRLGTHEVHSRLGAGGMGEVWRARDTRLGREVALKVLPDDVALDPDRRRRFEREARLLAALNHPGIASLHGLEEADGILFLVMELVEGRTLAERLLPGALPVAGALGFARQIAEALESAHERGILHRDLKPQNIKLTPEGRVKLLDFGLAKALDPEDSGAPFSQRHTAASDSTAAGVVVGTAPYMSPEQARGEAVDRRTDVWAFGCVLFEMLAGRRAFPGPSRSEAIAAVLEREPDWSALPSDAPPSVRTLLSRCLQKDKSERLHDIADARIELKDAAASSAESVNSVGSASVARSARKGWRRDLIWGALVIGSALVGAWAAWRTQARPSVATLRLSIPAPPGTPLATQSSSFQHLALAPDGRRVAFMAGGRIFVRDVSAIESTALTSDGARSPFFSPDGSWVGYQQSLDLFKVPVAGGPPVRICTLPAGANVRGASWGPDDQIIFTPAATAGLWRVPASSGPPQKLTEPADGETSHRWPQLLPGGQAVLFTLQRGVLARDARLEALLLETGERRVLVEGSGFGRYSPTGHLIYARSGTLFAVPFDATSLRVRGKATPVVDDVHMNESAHSYADFDTAPSGALVYVPGFPKAVPPCLALGRSKRPVRSRARRETGLQQAAAFPGRAALDRASGNGARTRGCLATRSRPGILDARHERRSCAWARVVGGRPTARVSQPVVLGCADDGPFRRPGPPGRAPRTHASRVELERGWLVA